MAILGRIVKGVGGLYTVDLGDKKINALARKSVKYTSGNILIGDFVEVEKEGESFAIAKIAERKNSLQRPPVANIDCAFLLISKTPEPDFYLIDKMLVSLSMKDIDVYVIITKADLGMEEIYDRAVKDYKNHVKDVLLISSKVEEDVNKVKELMQGKLSCLIGQSAVGKSSLTNALDVKARFEVGELSKKINRGKQTTRHSEIVELSPLTYVMDTPGFSFFDLDMPPDELKKHYFDFNEYSQDCKFRSCNHVDEPDCAVKHAVEKGLISKERYERYLELYKELKDKWRKKYG